MTTPPRLPRCFELQDLGSHKLLAHLLPLLHNNKHATCAECRVACLHDDVRLAYNCASKQSQTRAMSQQICVDKHEHTHALGKPVVHDGIRLVHVERDVQVLLARHTCKRGKPKLRQTQTMKRRWVSEVEETAALPV